MAHVFFWNFRASKYFPYEARIKRLLKLAGLGTLARPGDLAAVKLHFGEAGGMGHLRALQLLPIITFLRKCGAKPVLTDTSTLYTGQRGEAVSHALLAARHGFDPNVLGAPVVIADGLRGSYEQAIPCTGKHFQTAWLAGGIVDADILVSVSHFKGHELAGFGGALKNLAMGCASRRGKMQLHQGLGLMAYPEHCAGCGRCVDMCSQGALHLDADHRIQLEKNKCVGCAACLHACTHHALAIDASVETPVFLERMAEYAAALLRNRRTLHINFVQQVSPDCDCMGYTDVSVCPDVGVLASTDPVALDQACLDLVNAAEPLYPSALPDGLRAGDDKFEALRPQTHGRHILAYAEALGAGERNYTLHEIQGNAD